MALEKRGGGDNRRDYVIKYCSKILVPFVLAKYRSLEEEGLKTQGGEGCREGEKEKPIVEARGREGEGIGKTDER